MIRVIGDNLGDNVKLEAEIKVKWTMRQRILSISTK